VTVILLFALCVVSQAGDLVSAPGNYILSFETGSGKDDTQVSSARLFVSM
jgi:hypothetical protein